MPEADDNRKAYFHIALHRGDIGAGVGEALDETDEDNEGDLSEGSTHGRGTCRHCGGSLEDEIDGEAEARPRKAPELDADSYSALFSRALKERT
jgi:hypothetical protein